MGAAAVVAKLWHLKRWLIGWLTPLVWAPIPFFIPTQEARCGYVVLVMITYWFTEVIPMAITALIPVALFPLFRIVDSDTIAKCYFNGTIMVFLGSLIAASAVEKSHLHERIALKVILATGTSPRRLFLGFIITTAFLSMWISNLASTALMIPIVTAALDQLTRGGCSADNDDATPSPESGSFSITATDGGGNGSGFSKKEAKRLRTGILLGICYAANIGGTGTLTGTSTNLVLISYLKELSGDGDSVYGDFLLEPFIPASDSVSFAHWFFFNIPGLIILVFITWIFLATFFLHQTKRNKLATERNEKRVYEIINKQYQQLGPITFHELAVLVLFGLLLALWFFRAPDFMPGWYRLLLPANKSRYISDCTPTMVVVLLFFLIPAQPFGNLRHSPPLLDWKTVHEKVSWSVCLLLGGGFAMSEGCKESGLSRLLGDNLSVLHSLSPSMIVGIMCLIAAMLTELISNTAACNTLLLVIQEMSTTINLNRLSVMLPVTVSCSYAFMLPFASGTNAIVFETAKMKKKDMVIPGFIMKIISVLVLMMMANVLGPVIFDFKSPQLN